MKRGLAENKANNLNKRKESNSMKGLKKIREERGLTQTQLAEAIGVKQQAVSFFERGAREPNLKMLKKLSGYLGCKIDDLL